MKYYVLHLKYEDKGLVWVVFSFFPILALKAYGMIMCVQYIQADNTDVLTRLCWQVDKQDKSRCTQARITHLQEKSTTQRPGEAASHLNSCSGTLDTLLLTVSLLSYNDGPAKVELSSYLWVDRQTHQSILRGEELKDRAAEHKTLVCCQICDPRQRPKLSSAHAEILSS